MRNVVAVVTFAALVVVGCASSGADTSGPETTLPGDQTLPTVAPTDNATTAPPNPESEPGDAGQPSEGDPQTLPNTDEIDDMVDSAVADLSDRLSVNSHAITVVSVESVMWPDGAMGCPQPGMSYTQALVEGVRVQLTVDGTPYWYHQGGSNPIRYCDQPSAIDPYSVGSSDEEESVVPGRPNLTPPTTTP